MKPSHVITLFLIFLILPLISRAQFSGDYAFANWQTIKSTVAGGVANGSPGFVIITGPDEIGGFNYPGTTDFSITMPAGKIISFDWQYQSDDIPGFDYSSYLVNGQEYSISDNDETNPTGSVSIALEAGDVFTFRVGATDGCCGWARLTITNFLAADPPPGSSCSTPAVAVEGSNLVPAVNHDYFWYSFTMPATPGKSLYITAPGHDIEVASGSCDNLNYLPGGNDDEVRISEPQPGEQIYIRLSTENIGNYQWNLAFIDTQPGDHCEIPVPAVLGENLLSGLGWQWYSYTMPNVANKLLVVEMDQDYDARIWFGDCDNLGDPASNDGRLVVPNIPGTQILISWYNWSHEDIGWTMSLQDDGSACTGPLTAKPGYNQTQSAPRWFKFTMPATGDITLTSVGYTSTDTYLKLYNTCEGALIASSDDFSAYQSQITISRTAQSDLYILWDNDFSSTGFEWFLDLNNLQQQISFTSLPDKPVNGGTFELTATSSSGLPITYQSSNPSIASVYGNVVTIHAIGTTTITATQTGNGDYLAAPDVQQNLVIKQAQSIYFDALPGVYLNNAPFNLTATASSGLAVTYESSDPNVATVVNNTVTIVGLGTTTITASQSGNSVYAAAPTAEQTLVVNKILQQINFAVLPIKYVNSPSFDLVATSSSGLPITFSSSNPTVATVTGNSVNILSAGTTTITATQAGNPTYAAAPQIERILTVNKLEQQISFEILAEKFVNSAAFDLTATSTSSLPISFNNSNPLVATINGNTVTILSAGTTTITALQTGDDTYAAAEVVARNLVVNKLSQSIAFDPLPAKQFGDNAFTLTSTATSGLPVTFQSTNASVATVSESTVTIHGAGTATIIASQSGNGQYGAAAPVERILTVGKIGQTLVFTNPGDKTFPHAAVSLSATTTSGLAITFQSSDESVATISGNVLTMHAPGSVTVTAIQTGNSNYFSALPVAHTICVKPSLPIITGDFLTPESPVLSSSNGAGNQWFRNGIAIPNATGATFVVTEAGEYKVATTLKNCTSEFSSNFTVLITAVNQEFQSITIHPNPASHSISISGVSKVTRFEILGLNGVKIEVQGNWSSTQRSSTIDLEHLSNGIYFLFAIDPTETRVIKFIKK